MRSGSGKLLALALAALGLIAASPTSAPPPAPGEPGYAEWAAQRAQAYLRSREEEFAKRREMFALAQLQAHYEIIRKAVAQHLRRSEGPTWDPAVTLGTLYRHRVETFTGLMLNNGYRAEQVAHPSGARTLVRAWGNIFGGDADALVLAAPMVFVAEQVRTDKLADGSRHVIYRVSKPIKASLAVGTEFPVELNGPWDWSPGKPGNPPPPPPPPNPAMHELTAHKSAVFFMAPGERVQPMPRPGRPVSIFGPMPIRGNEVLPGYHSGTSPTTLAAIRAAAQAQLCSPGYVPVVAGTNLPHRC